MPELPKVASAGARHGGTGARVCAWLRWQCPRLERQGGLRAVSVMSPGVPRTQEGQFGPKAWGQGQDLGGPTCGCLGHGRGCTWQRWVADQTCSAVITARNARGSPVPSLSQTHRDCFCPPCELVPRVRVVQGSWAVPAPGSEAERMLPKTGAPAWLGSTWGGPCTGAARWVPRTRDHVPGAGCRGPRAENRVLSP